MIEWLTYNYLWLKAFHIISFVAWMAGLFYLPRLYVYHTRVNHGSEAAQLFETMEHKLLKIIMNPAMITTWGLGLLMIKLNPVNMQEAWLHHKITMVIILSGFQGYLSVTRKTFAKGKNRRSEKFYRIINEVPTICLITIILLVVFKPF